MDTRQLTSRLMVDHICHVYSFFVGIHVCHAATVCRRQITFGNVDCRQFDRTCVGITHFVTYGEKTFFL